jgi:hypothetical protein
MIMGSHLIIPNGPNILANYGILHERKGDGCHEAQRLEWGEHMSNAFLAFEILNLFEKVEGTSNAHGWSLQVWMLPYQPCSN